MSDHPHDREAATALTALRAALTAHGITLPSLDLHPLSYAGRYDAPPLIRTRSCASPSC
ncbi:hypothetical protein [Streptomyces sp. TE12347]